jgi:hypothetical protein
MKTTLDNFSPSSYDGQSVERLRAMGSKMVRVCTEPKESLVKAHGTVTLT